VRVEVPDEDTGEEREFVLYREGERGARESIKRGSRGQGLGCRVLGFRVLGPKTLTPKQ
jgi:hypothetical protein